MSNCPKDTIGHLYINGYCTYCGEPVPVYAMALNPADSDIQRLVLAAEIMLRHGITEAVAGIDTKVSFRADTVQSLRSALSLPAFAKFRKEKP